MEAVNVFTFTLNILAAIVLPSVRFSFKNFFACSTSRMVISEDTIHSDLKRDLLLFEKGLANELQMKLENLINETKRD